MASNHLQSLARCNNRLPKKQITNNKKIKKLNTLTKIKATDKTLIITTYKYSVV